jgi:hypothetical protein
MEKKLEEQGFVMVPTGGRNIYDIYESAKRANEPILVTQDVVLHTAHNLFDYTLRALEIETLLPKLRELTAGMMDACFSQAKDAKGEVVKQAAYDNFVFFAVAGELLGLTLPEGIPEEVREKIELETKLVEVHRGPVKSVLFGYQEDYTQYIVRGHYTRNAGFEQYFRAMMWYGRMGFYIRPDATMYLEAIDPVQEGIELTRRAILITKIVRDTPGLAAQWEGLYGPTTYFAGKADDYTVKDYETILKGVDVSKDRSVLSFIERAKKLPAPKIMSVVAVGTEIDTAGLKGFRFMGQRFIPDSYIFQNLVFPNVTHYTGKGLPFTLEVTNVGPQRCFPRALDVMSVFGSRAAADILGEEGDTEYIRYEAQIKKLKSGFSHLPASQWTENLYWRWLHILKKLVTTQHVRCPEFMRSDSWRLKELNAALGSWTQLRHDTILYGKQSYTLVGMGAPRNPELTEGWVEPYPEIYKLISDFILALGKTGECPKDVEEKLTEFSELLIQLSIISEKELKGSSLTEKECRLIWNIGATLKQANQFSSELMRKITSGADEEMAIIADVHTDGNTGKVLEEAVGNPMEIYVKLSGNKIVKGGTFSYYEFKAAAAERYTDEKWQERLRSDEPPELQKWFVPVLGTD